MGPSPVMSWSVYGEVGGRKDPLPVAIGGHAVIRTYVIFPYVVDQKSVKTWERKEFVSWYNSNLQLNYLNYLPIIKVHELIIQQIFR